VEVLVLAERVRTARGADRGALVDFSVTGVST